MKKATGIQLARSLKKELLKQGIPVRQLFLYGSVAKGKTHKWSDVDIAVICDPFGSSRLEENLACSTARWDIDLRIETVCLHPEDLKNGLSTLAHEVKKYGIAV